MISSCACKSAFWYFLEIKIAGNAAELVDPLDVESIRAGITTILNETTEQQQTRGQRMIIRQHMFSWKVAAEQTLQVYHQAQLAATEKQ